MKKVYVKDIMHKITVVDADTKVSKAAKMMADKNIGSLMVKEEGAIDGILTERDILKKVVGKDLDPRTTKVSEVMTLHPLIIDAKATLEDAAEIFNNVHIRRLPVIQRGEIIGIITSRDVARAIGKWDRESGPKMKETLVKDIMHKITVVDATATVSDVTKLMAKKNIGSVLVRKSGDIIGILTERDILKKGIAGGLDVQHTPVSEIMVLHPYIIDSEATAHDASHVLSKYRIRRLPVLERGKIIGMVTARDVAKSLRYSFFKKRQHHTRRWGGRKGKY